MNSRFSLLVPGLLSLTFWSCGETKRGEPESSPPKAKTPPASKVVTADEKTAAQTDADLLIKRLNASIKAEEKIAVESKSWLAWEKVSKTHLALARLNGDVNHFIKAQKALDEAFKIAKPGAGPFLTRASYNLTIHKISEVEKDLLNFEKKIIIKKDERAQVSSLRGAVFFLSGDLSKALERFENAEKLKPTSATAARIANYNMKIGEYEKARSWYKKAVERTEKSDKNGKAWAELHLGIVDLEENKVEKAERNYDIANQSFTGWYLINEHIAEAAFLTGSPKAAIERYEEVLKKRPKGEFYNAIGEVYLSIGEKEKSVAAFKKASAAFEADIAILPSAASGHALDYFFEHDHKRALLLAEKNFELRPGHESRVQLAKAYMLNKKDGEARKVLSPTLDTKWATNDYLTIAATLFEKTKPKRAAEMKARVEKIDPGCVKDFKESLPQ